MILNFSIPFFFEYNLEIKDNTLLDYGKLTTKRTVFMFKWHRTIFDIQTRCQNILLGGGGVYLGEKVDIPKNDHVSFVIWMHISS